MAILYKPRDSHAFIGSHLPLHQSTFLILLWNDDNMSYTIYVTSVIFIKQPLGNVCSTNSHNGGKPIFRNPTTGMGSCQTVKDFFQKAYLAKWSESFV